MINSFKFYLHPQSTKQIKAMEIDTKKEGREGKGIESVRWSAENVNSLLSSAHRKLSPNYCFHWQLVK